MQTPTTRELTLIRTFDAPRELVFRAWTDPSLVAAWWGPRGFTNPVCEVDARPGGAIRIHMRGPDDTVYPMTGHFEEVVPPERLVFISAAIGEDPQNPILENRNTVTFAELGRKTQVTLQVVVLKATEAAAGPLAGMEAGWSQSLEKLGELVRKLEK